MELKPLTLIAPKIQVSELFPALKLIMSHQAIEEAISETNSQEKRNRLLPTHLIIALVIALNLWSKDSVVDVLKNLVQGLSASWIPQGMRWKTPSKSSISEARQRVGCRVMTRLFEKLARPIARRETPTAFIKGLRWMAIDGTVFDLPDT
ncbi:transposase (fragment) [Hyella patelloides LEGE 07179]|uniref:Transposase n=1 Tax=Hyella patelloides LEGE 07179 TaxID=945734 RepID=A0A563VJ61_9CYAN